MKHIFKHKYFLIAVVLILTLLGSITFVVAKYISDTKKGSSNINPINFYLTSDYAKNGGASYETSDWAAGTIIKLYNYDFENPTKVTESNVLYTVNVSTDWTVTVKDEYGNIVTLVDGTYELISSTSTYHEIIINYTGVKVLPDPFNVIIESTSPYKYYLEATFTPTVSATPEYLIEDFGNYWIVTIKTNAYVGNITVNWEPEEVSPDNTDPLMNGWLDTSPSEVLPVSSFATYELIFVENKVGNYSFTTKYSNVVEVSEGGAS